LVAKELSPLRKKRCDGRSNAARAVRQCSRPMKDIKINDAIRTEPLFNGSVEYLYYHWDTHN